MRTAEARTSLCIWQSNIALTLLYVSFIYLIYGAVLFLTVPWVGLQFVIVVFPCHTHFLLKDTPQYRRWDLKLRPLCRESGALPLSYDAPMMAE